MPPKIIKTVTKVTKSKNQNQQRKRRNKKIKKKRSIPRNPSNRLEQQYLKCLSNPFNCPPVRAGFGCMVPTELHSAYLRTNIVTASDGSFTAFVLPNPQNLFLWTFAGFATPVTTANSGFSQSGNCEVIKNLSNSSRTLAMGVRIYPMIPATVAPGVIQIGCAPRVSLADVVAPTDTSGPNSTDSAPLFNREAQYVTQLPYLREHMARPGGTDFIQCTWRPTDNKDFEFTDCDSKNIKFINTGGYQPFCPTTNTTSGAPALLDTQGSFLVVSGQSLPASTTIFVEIILHIETTSSTTLIDQADTASIQPSVADTGNFPTMESMYRSIAPYLPSVDTVVGAAQSLATSRLGSHLGQVALNRYRSQVMGVRSSGYMAIEQLD